MSDVGDIQNKIAGTMGLDEGGARATTAAFAWFATFNKAAADGMASTATAATKFITFSNPLSTPLRVKRVSINPSGSLTADTANNATITISTDDGVGGAAAAAFAITTTTTGNGGTGNWVANTSLNYDAATNTTLFTAANLAVGAGGNLWITIAKGGTGVVVPICNVTVELEKL